MAGLRYRTLAETVLSGMADKYPDLRNPERKMEVADLASAVYRKSESDDWNLAAIGAAAAGVLEVGHHAKEEERHQTANAIYAVNVLRLTRGRAEAVAMVYATCDSRDMLADVEEMAATQAIQDGLLDPGGDWRCLSVEVPFDDLDDDAVLRFYGGRVGKVDLVGTVIAGTVRGRLAAAVDGPATP